MSRFVLIHSPLVGSATWSLVQEAMARRGVEASVPSLTLADTEPVVAAYWAEHARAVARAVEPCGAEEPLALVGHSGAGPALPALRQALPNPVELYLFVDAGLPRDGASRFDLFGSEGQVQQFRASAKDGFLPTWSEEDLREDIPDDGIRARFVAELKPLPVGVYEEPLPVFDGWPDAPCAYLRWTRFYGREAGEARRRGWPVRELPGTHFQMLVDPVGVAETLLRMAEAAVGP
jgi:hypothetical protein